MSACQVLAEQYLQHNLVPVPHAVVSHSTHLAEGLLHPLARSKLGCCQQLFRGQLLLQLRQAGHQWLVLLLQAAVAAVILLQLWCVVEPGGAAQQQGGAG